MYSHNDASVCDFSVTLFQNRPVDPRLLPDYVAIPDRGVAGHRPTAVYL